MIGIAFSVIPLSVLTGTGFYLSYRIYQGLSAFFPGVPLWAVCVIVYGAALLILGFLRSALPVVVLDHNPSHIGEYTTEADLILCGHTHRGILFPISLITDRLFDVDYGYYRRDGRSPQVIVTSGMGNWGMPMRVGSDCEVVSIRLISDD